MRRLERLPRDQGERGATAVMVALLMVVLLGSAAFAVDFGRIVAEKGQLQNGADAAALAVADSCANTATKASCLSDGLITASTYAKSNTNDLTGVAGPPTIDQGSGTVTVSTTTPTGAIPMTFAQILGINTMPISATATATWGYPKSGLSVLPLAFSGCEFDLNSSSATPINQKILIQGTPDCSSTNPSGANFPGGFAWLSPTGPGPCDVKVTAGPEADLSTWIKTSTGASIPSNCKYLFNDPTNHNYALDKTVALPVYDDIATTPPVPNPSASGSNTWYHVAKWAGFHVLGWNLPSMGSAVGQGTWTGAEKGLYGYFVGFSADPSIFQNLTMDPNGQGNLYVVKLNK